MGKLFGWLITIAILIGVFVFFSNWQEGRRQERARETREAREAEQRAEQQRSQILAQTPPAVSTPLTAPATGQNPAAPALYAPPSAPQLDGRKRQEFLALAQEYQVEVLEYRAVTNGEVVVTLRSRVNQAIQDLMDRAIRAGIMLDFDDDMQRQNDQATMDPNSGAIIYQTRFTFQVG